MLIKWLMLCEKYGGLLSLKMTTMGCRIPMNPILLKMEPMPVRITEMLVVVMKMTIWKNSS